MERAEGLREGGARRSGSTSGWNASRAIERIGAPREPGRTARARIQRGGCDLDRNALRRSRKLPSPLRIRAATALGDETAATVLAPLRPFFVRAAGSLRGGAWGAR